MKRATFDLGLKVSAQFRLSQCHSIRTRAWEYRISTDWLTVYVANRAIELQAKRCIQSESPSTERLSFSRSDERLSLKTSATRRRQFTTISLDFACILYCLRSATTITTVLDMCYLTLNSSRKTSWSNDEISLSTAKAFRVQTAKRT